MVIPVQHDRVESGRAETTVCHFCDLEFVATDHQGIELDNGEFLEVCGLCRERMHCDDCDMPMNLADVHAVLSSEEGWTVFLCEDCYEKELTGVEQFLESSASIFVENK